MDLGQLLTLHYTNFKWHTSLARFSTFNDHVANFKSQVTTGVVYVQDLLRG